MQVREVKAVSRPWAHQQTSPAPNNLRGSPTHTPCPRAAFAHSAECPVLPEGCCGCTYLCSLPSLPWTCTVAFPPALSAAALDKTCCMDPQTWFIPLPHLGLSMEPVITPQLCQPLQNLAMIDATVTSASGAALLMLLPDCSCVQQHRSCSIAKKGQKALLWKAVTGTSLTCMHLCHRQQLKKYITIP